MKNMLKDLLAIWNKDSIRYWEKRAKKYGARSVLNIGHSKEEIDAVTNMQKQILYPLFKGLLNGQEKVVLDFGCGTGRFTRDLGALIQGMAIGIDPIDHLLSIARGGG